MLKINANKYLPTQFFKRNEVDCVLCHVRKRLIQVKPEELVRQSIIKFLNLDLSIPLSRIEAEVPLTHFVKGKRGRADLIVYGDDGNVKLVVECKANTELLLDDHVEQAVNYGSVLNAPFLMTTNGIHASWYKESETDGFYYKVKGPLNYFHLIGSQKPELPKIAEYTEQFLPQEEQWLPETNDDITLLKDYGLVGEDTFPALYPAILKIHFAFQEETSFPISPIGNYKISEDFGLRFTSFGNAGGGNFPGHYRCLLIEDQKRNHQLVCLGINASARTVNDPFWGNRKGVSYLFVGIDDFDKSHPSIELNLNRFLTFDRGIATVWHDGTLTNGKKGAVKRDEVVSFVQDKAPELVQDGKIHLGSFEINGPATFGREDYNSLFKNVIHYALLRDEFRRYKSRKTNLNR